VSPHHANFIINTGNATAADILALKDRIQEAVAKRFGISLSPEVEIVGE
jgi:UDP-N-acetylmuramate dehydrogenase